MATTNGDVITSQEHFGLWHRGFRSLRPWHWLALAVIITAAGLGFALGHSWLALADLAPLLYVAPCAAMMFMCMKGMNRSEQGEAAHSSAVAEGESLSDRERR